MSFKSGVKGRGSDRWWERRWWRIQRSSRIWVYQDLESDEIW